MSQKSRNQEPKSRGLVIPPPQDMSSAYVTFSCTSNGKKVLMSLVHEGDVSTLLNQKDEIYSLA